MKRIITAGIALFMSYSAADAAMIYSNPRPWGGTYLTVMGEIRPGDDKAFGEYIATTNMPRPIYVRPIGPGGEVTTALAIADMIWDNNYWTAVENNDVDTTTGYRGCGSACTFLWLGGRRSMVGGRAIMQFHSCAKGGVDDIDCNAMVAKHLMRFGLSAYQAMALTSASPHETARTGTLPWAASMGFQWQNVWGPGAGDRCTYRFCVLMN